MICRFYINICQYMQSGKIACMFIVSKGMMDKSGQKKNRHYNNGLLSIKKLSLVRISQ